MGYKIVAVDSSLSRGQHKVLENYIVAAINKIETLLKVIPVSGPLNVPQDVCGAYWEDPTQPNYGKCKEAMQQTR